MLSTDPIDLALDPISHDLSIVKGVASLSAGVAGVMQSVRIRLAMIAGEWFLDLDLGVPFFERVGVTAAQALFGQKYDQAKAIAAFRAALVGTPALIAITTLTVTFDGPSRSMTVLWAAKTAFGDTPLDTLALGK